MKWVIIILIVLAVLLLAGLIWTSMKRKKDQVARERASELRSDAAQTATQHQEEEAKARAAQAEAERARAEADRLDAKAQEQQTSYTQTKAQHEDALREADRVDPDVDHRADDYAPGAHNAPATGHDHLGHDHDEHDQGGSTGTFPATERGETHGQVNPPPAGPETTVPDEAYERGYEDGQDPNQSFDRPRTTRDDV